MPDTDGVRRGQPALAPVRPPVPDVSKVASQAHRVAEPVGRLASLTEPWSGTPDQRAFRRRLIVRAAVLGAVSLVIGVAMISLSLLHDHLFIYPLVGSLAAALGLYGVLVRPLLVVRAARQVRYRVDGRGVELRWSRERVLSIPGDHLPPFTVEPSPRGRGQLTDVLFVGPPPWVSPWGAWRIVDDTWGMVCLDKAEDVVAALRLLRAASPTPAVWAAGVTTPPQTSFFVRALKHRLHLPAEDLPTEEDRPSRD